MAKWERYIVYPLLFVALFFSVARETKVLQAAGGIVDEIRADVVRARRVVISDSYGRSQVELVGGRITMDGSEGRAELTTEFGGCLRLQDTGNSEVRLEAGEGGGFMGAYNPEGELGFCLVATKEGGSVRIFNPQGEPRVFLGTATGTGHGGVWVYDKYGKKSCAFVYK